ncbi:DUF2878 domain-containing protein [Desulfogranum japonicum]|uniref:DUF2878 domain-containing protein n=1 Tax=Desulfogranum japonicum TaxID=231447 RepID=UPI001E30E592|nr:DUF2878 domain-containing protein [Desulfogranum japonicum]
MKNLLNVLLYQCIWFLSVLGGTTGAGCSLVLVMLHLVFTDKKCTDLCLMGFMLVTGLLVDGILTWVDFFTFYAPAYPIPFWLMVLWIGLAITPGHSLAWMQNKPLLSLFFGAVGGPAAYWAGVRLDAAAFNWPLSYSLVTLAIIWGCLWPLVMRMTVLIEGRCRRYTSSL